MRFLKKTHLNVFIPLILRLNKILFSLIVFKVCIYMNTLAYVYIHTIQKRRVFIFTGNSPKK